MLLARASGRLAAAALRRPRGPGPPRPPHAPRPPPARSLVAVVAPRRARTLRARARRAYALALGPARRAPLLTDRLAHALGNTSFVLVTLSFLSTDILTLRALSVAAGALMFVFNLGAMERAMVMSMRWGALLIAINCAQIGKLSMERRVGILPPREAAVYRQFFAGGGRLLSESQFWRVADAGEWQTLHRGADVTLEGCPNEFVWLVLDGEMRVHRHGDAAAADAPPAASTTLGTLGPGSWVGERGYLRQFALPALEARDSTTAPSFATVTVASPAARLLRWRRADLQRAMDGDRVVGGAVLLSMTRDVVRKLHDQSERSVAGAAKAAAAGWWGAPPPPPPRAAARPRPTERPKPPPADAAAAPPPDADAGAARPPLPRALRSVSVWWMDGVARRGVAPGVGEGGRASDGLRWAAGGMQRSPSSRRALRATSPAGRAGAREGGAAGRAAAARPGDARANGVKR